MITEHDLKEAIAECQGERNPNANTCIKLAAFYTIQREMFGRPEIAMTEPGKSYTAGPLAPAVYESDTEFGQAIEGMDTVDVLRVVDELMSTLQVVQPRLYTSVLRKLRD